MFSKVRMTRPIVSQSGRKGTLGGGTKWDLIDIGAGPSFPHFGTE